jgi:hypothetical protein
MAFMSWLAGVLGHGVAGAADTQTLTIHRYTLNSTEVLNQLLRFYATDDRSLLC